MKNALRQWLESGAHLPEPLRDFHDQKRLFKAMHYRYRATNNPETPGWIAGQCYVIDWFLWFMAKHGYTLQRTRTKRVDFEDLDATIAAWEAEETAAFKRIMKQDTPPRPATGGEGESS